MTFIEEFKKFRLVLGAAAAAFAAGWGASEAVMIRAGQDKVVAGTYILLKDLNSENSNYVKRDDFNKLSQINKENEENTISLKYKLDIANNKIQHLDDKIQNRIELENLKTKLKKELDQKVIDLAIASPILIKTLSEQNNNIHLSSADACTTELCSVIHHDIADLENNISEIESKIISSY